jgi:hypothetical protein
MPSLRLNAAGMVVNGLFYVVGGTDISGQALTTVEVYDPNSNSWRTVSGLPAPAGELAGGAINGVLYTAGGSVNLGSSELATASAYYP